MLIASLSAFVVGDLVNDKVFCKLKKRHPDSHKGFEIRAVVSSFCGEMVDSVIFLPIAFVGQMPFETLVKMLFTQVAIKTAYEAIALPLTTILVKLIGRKEAL